MEIKMVNPDKVSEKNKMKFYEFMKEASEEFHIKAEKYLDNLYSVKSAWFYRPKKLLIKLGCYLIGIGMMFELVNAVDNYIGIILYNQNLLWNCLLNCSMIVVQTFLLTFILRNEMVQDSDYQHECYIKFIHSDCVKQYENKLLAKAKELNIELEINKEKE